MKVFFITGNVSKIKLARDRLSRYGIAIEQKSFNFEEIQHFDVIEVAKNKANQVMDHIEGNFIIEDSAFYIDSLNGFPGTFLKFAFDTLGDKRISFLVDQEINKRAEVRGVLIFGNTKTKELKIFLGTYSGKISSTPRGENVRGWKVTRIFIPDSFDKTLAELDDKEWGKFLEVFNKNDHYEKFGQWVKNKKRIHSI